MTKYIAECPCCRSEFDGTKSEMDKKAKEMAARFPADKAAALEKALDLHLRFLGSLNKGWLGGVCGDIGTLNDAYIASRVAYKLMGKPFPR